MVWDTSTPAGTESKSQGDDRIRELKTDIQTALRGDETEGTEAVFPGADTSSPVFRYRGLKGTTAARPAAANYGLYVNTTLNTIQRDNGSSWDDVATLIPSGTVMVFYQAAAPTGWTKVVTQNDKALRVVSGSGGVAGGTVAFSTTLAHTHTVASHTHDLGSHTHSTPNHRHVIDNSTSSVAAGNGFANPVQSANSDGADLGVDPDGGALITARTMKNQTVSSGSGTSGAPSTNVSGATAPATDSQLGALAYVDVILCSKD